jgi:hypothetical protein
MQSCHEADRLAELIRRHIGWQVNDLAVEITENGVILRGRAYTRLARALAEVEAARLSGLPVVANEMNVS